MYIHTCFYIYIYIMIYSIHIYHKHMYLQLANIDQCLHAWAIIQCQAFQLENPCHCSWWGWGVPWWKRAAKPTANDLPGTWVIIHGYVLTVLRLPSQKNTWKECHLDSLVSWLRMGIWSFIQWQQSRFRFHRVSDPWTLQAGRTPVSTSATNVFKGRFTGRKWLGSGWWFAICLPLGDKWTRMYTLEPAPKNSTSGVAGADHRVETNTICLKTQRRKWADSKDTAQERQEAFFLTGSKNNIGLIGMSLLFLLFCCMGVEVFYNLFRGWIRSKFWLHFLKLPRW